MSKPSSQFVVFIIGLVLLGLFYGTFDAMFANDWLFFSCVIAYLLVLRLVGYAVARVLKVR